VTEQLATEQLMDRTTNTFLAVVEAKNLYILVYTRTYTLHIQDARNLEQDARNLEQDARNLEQDARTTVSFA